MGRRVHCALILLAMGSAACDVNDGDDDCQKTASPGTAQDVVTQSTAIPAGGCNDCAEPGPVSMAEANLDTNAIGIDQERVFGSVSADCNGACTVFDYRWTITSDGAEATIGTFLIKYNVSCTGEGDGPSILSVTVPATGLAVIDDTLALSTPGFFEAPCGKSDVRAAPVLSITNNTNFSALVSGPGGAANPTADCSLFASPAPAPAPG